MELNSDGCACGRDAHGSEAHADRNALAKNRRNGPYAYGRSTRAGSAGHFHGTAPAGPLACFRLARMQQSLLQGQVPIRGRRPEDFQRSNNAFACSILGLRWKSPVPFTMNAGWRAGVGTKSRKVPIRRAALSPPGHRPAADIRPERVRRRMARHSHDAQPLKLRMFRIWCRHVPARTYLRGDYKQTTRAPNNRRRTTMQAEALLVR